MLSIKGTLTIHSYFFASNIRSKNFEIISIINIEISQSLLRLKVKSESRVFDIKISRDNHKITTAV